MTAPRTQTDAKPALPLTTTWRSFPAPLRFLTVNQFTINAGFYMLMPYLAAHLAGPLGLAGWAVGFVLGVRNLSQQGLFLLGGALADRYGRKPMIVAGCLLRTAGFVLLAVATSLPALVVASAATGFAGALFNPAVRATVADQAGDRRVEAFSVFNLFYQAGMFAGPLIGLALLAFDFRWVAAGSALLFGVLSVCQILLLPCDAKPAAGHAGVLASWREVFANRRFLAFSAAMTGTYVLSFQVYLALPLQAERAFGDAGDTATTALFAVSALTGVLAQGRLTAYARARWSPGRAIAHGAALMGAAFVPLLLSGGLAALLATTALLAAGSALAYPFEMDTVVRLSGDRLVATHYGLYNTVCGIGITVGTIGTGALWDASARAGLTALPWLLMAATGLGCAVCVAALDRSGRLRLAHSPG
ncbi:MFS transporter [Yinghuangia aomiensis]|uniref:MFS transporter n=1 Tax=Yinghuangia aomiensis TaxID=676205 RepID=A0ABP9HL13_9ACTN